MYFTNRARAFSSRVMPPLYLTVGELRSSLKQVLQFVAGKCTHKETGPEKLPIPRCLPPTPPDLYSPRAGSPCYHSPPGLWAIGLTLGGRSGTFIPGLLPPAPPDLYSPQGRLPFLVPSVPRDRGIWASPLEVGLELLFQV